jgi:hypothetical protein
MAVGPVLITSWHVSEYLRKGPVTARAYDDRECTKKGHEEPIAQAVSWANFRKRSRTSGFLVAGSTHEQARHLGWTCMEEHGVAPLEGGGQRLP